MTQDELKELLDYTPETGVFRWRRLTSPLARYSVGDEVGTICADGYRVIGINRRYYKAHRLAFLFMIGRFPTSEVDHINRDRLDNRWSNLREATKSQNMMNRFSTRKTEGLRGVTWHKRIKKWHAQIRKNKITKSLGYYDNPHEAHQVYLAAARSEFGDFVYQE